MCIVMTSFHGLLCILRGIISPLHDRSIIRFHVDTIFRRVQSIRIHPCNNINGAVSYLRYQKAIAESMELEPAEYVLSAPYQDAGGAGLVTTLTCRVR